MYIYMHRELINNISAVSCDFSSSAWGILLTWTCDSSRLLSFRLDRQEIANDQ
jgi:hypothetical protein